MTGEIVFDSRLTERFEDTVNSHLRKLRKAVRDHAPKEEIERLLHDMDDLLRSRKRDLVCAFIQHRKHGQAATEEEIAAMEQYLEDGAAKYFPQDDAA